MNIGILGSGDVARTLAKGFVIHGHPVMLGTRAPDKLTDWLVQYPAVKTGSFSDAARFADVIVLAVKGSAAENALQLAGVQHMNSKTIIDATNPIADTPPEKGVLHYFTSLESSLMEQLQWTFPDANFVKAFNSVGNSLMVNPEFEHGPPSMFICGNNAESKQIVTGILQQFGWDAVDMGSAEAARAIEPLCMLWCIPGFMHDQWHHAFKFLR